jgi:hypothetical protein
VSRLELKVEEAGVDAAAAMGASATHKPVIVADLYQAFKDGRSLVDIIWEQQRLHESRRWSAVIFGWKLMAV